MNDKDFMLAAIEQASLAAGEGEVPVGAVIVRNGEIISTGRNRREYGKNALYHAEIEAIDNACRTLGGWRLPGCEMYVTLEPCPMCAGAIINSRIQNLIIAGDDAAYESAKKYIDDVINGKIGIIGDSKILEGLRTTPYATSGTRNITELIEMQQYLKAGWFNELGLNANYNMKREAINADEAQMNHDALYPLIDDMLNSRKICIDKVNDMFETSIFTKPQFSLALFIILESSSFIT